MCHCLDQLMILCNISYWGYKQYEHFVKKIQIRMQQPVMSKIKLQCLIQKVVCITYCTLNPHKQMYVGIMLVLPFYHWARTVQTLGQPIVFTGIYCISVSASHIQAGIAKCNVPHINITLSILNINKQFILTQSMFVASFLDFEHWNQINTLDVLKYINTRNNNCLIST